MSKGRLEAFSDGVLAIVITIMVLELKVPHDTSIGALLALWPRFLSYVVSFVFLGIYWNNHHHLYQATRHIGGGVLWANLHLLFWLSLVPFVTGWMGENHFASLTVAVYGVVLLCSAIAYYILVRTLLALHDENSDLVKAIGSDIKGRISIVIYAVALPLAFVEPLVAAGMYVLVAILWLVPDRRIERALSR